MKNIFITLLILLSAKFIQAQPVTVKISNPKRNYVVFHSPHTYNLAYKSDTIKLSNDGTFRYSVPSGSSPKNGLLEITPDQTLKLWFASTASLTISLKESSTIPVFSGPLARIHQYLQTEDQYWEKAYKGYEQRNPDFKKPPFLRSDGYYRITDSLTTDRLSFLEKYFSGPKTGEEQSFIAVKKKELLYGDLFFKLSYDDPPLEKFLFYQRQVKTSSSAFYQFSDGVSFNDPGLLDNPYFLNFSRLFFMELVFRFQKEQKTKLSKEKFYKKFFLFVDQYAGNKLCNAVLKASFINDEINTMTIDEKNTALTYSRFVDSLQTYSSIRKEARFIENSFNGKLAKLYALKKGTVAPPCTLTDTAGQVFSLESFKGKLLYIDVWASWCGKCIEAIPQWNKLANKFRGNPNVAFITISTDVVEDKETWLKLLNKFKPGGQHFISAGGTDSEFARKFLIGSYPTNILIDKEGHIINIKADRPETINLASYLQ